MAHNGGTFSVCLNKNTCTLWGFGSNEHGQLGEKKHRSILIPTQILSDYQIYEVACGNTFTIVLDSESNVWGFGSNTFGQLGNGTISTSTDFPVQVQLKENISIQYVSCGTGHTVCLDTSGNCWSFGLNGVGQLGIGTLKNVSVPVKVEINNIVSIACGNAFTLFLDNKNLVYGTGHNNSGQLGKKNSYCSKIPEKIKNFKDICAIAAGSEHSLFLSSDGNVFSCGNNVFGQIGFSKK